MTQNVKPSKPIGLAIKEVFSSDRVYSVNDIVPPFGRIVTIQTTKKDEPLDEKKSAPKTKGLKKMGKKKSKNQKKKRRKR